MRTAAFSVEFDKVKKAHKNALINASFIMTITQSIYARTTVSMTDLRRNPSGILEDAGDSPIAVLNHNKPAAYLLSAKAYEALLERLDDAELTKIVKQRQGGKRVKVTLEDL
jgi:antitoxin StbD